MISVKFVRVSLACFGICVLFAATYAYSPSGEYGLNKTLITLFVPTLCILAGFVVARDGRLHLLLTTSAALAAMTAIVFTIRGHDPSQFAESDVRQRELIITYQNFSFVMALASVWSIDRLARRLPRLDVISVVCLFAFVYFILVSGGRIGVLLVFVTIMIYLWRRTRQRLLAMSLIGTCALVAAIFVLVIENHAIEIVNSPDAPPTLKRMVSHAFLDREGIAFAE